MCEQQEQALTCPLYVTEVDFLHAVFYATHTHTPALFFIVPGSKDECTEPWRAGLRSCCTPYIFLFSPNLNSLMNLISQLWNLSRARSAMLVWKKEMKMCSTNCDWNESCVLISTTVRLMLVTSCLAAGFTMGAPRWPITAGRALRSCGSMMQGDVMDSGVRQRLRSTTRQMSRTIT